MTVVVLKVSNPSSKDEFLAMLGHELRNPLGAISTALFLLREGPADPATQERALEVATRQAFD